MRYRNAPAHIRAAINQQADRWTTTTGEPLTDILRLCHCKQPADVYAMAPYAGDWAGYYCLTHVPTGFTITDYVGEEDY